MQFANSMSPRARVRRGLTLVEMLVAMTCTILLMFAITQTFQSIGEVSAKGRAAIEISTQLRGVQHRLHKDFESLTVPVRPWPEAGAGEGYLEILEGGLVRDNTYHGTSFDLYGDFDDIWAMTIRSTGEPFVGRFRGQMIQSHLAEVIWFTSFVDRDGSGTFTDGEPLNLHRRVLLIRPDLNDGTSGNLGVQGSSYGYWDFLQQNDVSIRWMSNDMLAANSLADLTQRENRFGHVLVDASASSTPPHRRIDGFPHNLNVVNGTLNRELVLGWNRNATPQPTFNLDRTGEDIMLSNVLAADIRVYDPDAPIRSTSDPSDPSAPPGEPVTPGDPGFGSTPYTIGYGTYVDLGYNQGAGFFSPIETTRYSNLVGGAPILSGSPAGASQILTQRVYDTWSYYYEHDGVNQDGDSVGINPLIDEGVNGLDDNNTNGVDDVGERETSPPYPVPLRGVQVRIRVLEVETSQVRQATVVQDFIPE